MLLVCHDCWNNLYFDFEIEGIRELKTENGELIIQDTKHDGFNFSENYIRENLMDIVRFVIKNNAGVISWDPESESYFNNYVKCARCGSKKVSKPYSIWSSNGYRSIEKELLDSREEFKQLRRERRYADQMPFLLPE